MPPGAVPPGTPACGALSPPQRRAPPSPGSPSPTKAGPLTLTLTRTRTRTRTRTGTRTLTLALSLTLSLTLTLTLTLTKAGRTAASLFRGLLCGLERKQPTSTSYTFEDWMEDLMVVEDWAGLTNCAGPRKCPADWSAAMRHASGGMDDAQSPASSASSSPRYHSAFMDQSFFP